MALTQISTGGVKDDAISAGKIPANAVGSSEIADDAVGAAQIADDGVAQAAVADEAIDEARLQISNAGTNGQFLQKQSGNTGGLTWATATTDTSDKASLSGATFTGDVVFDGETANKDITFDRSENWLKFNDETKAVFGTTSNTTLFHNGTDLYIQNGAGDIRFEPEAGAPGLWLHRDGSIELYDGNASGTPQKKLETTATGINVTGQINVNGSALSAAPELSGTADGAINIGKTVSVNSNGTFRQAGTVITVNNPPTKLAQDLIVINSNNGYHQLIYDTDNDNYIMSWFNHQNSYTTIHRGTAGSNGAITWNTQTTFIGTGHEANQLSMQYVGNKKTILSYKRSGNLYYKIITNDTNASGNGFGVGSELDFISSSNDGGFSKLAYDSTNSKIIGCYRNDSNGYPKYAIGTLASGATQITWGSAADIVSAAASNIMVFKPCFDPDTARIILGYELASNTQVQLKVLNASDGTLGSAVACLDGDTSYYNPPEFLYDTFNNRLVIVYRTNSTGNTGGAGIRCVVGTVTGGSTNSVTFGDSVLVAATGSNLEYFHAEVDNHGHVLVSWTDDANKDNYLRTGTIASSGNSVTFGTAAEVYTSTDASTLGFNLDPWHGKAMAFDPDADQFVIIWKRGAGSNVADVYSSTYSAQSTTTTADKYIGIAQSTVADGAAIKVDTFGATNNNQSSLSAGTTYYVQNDGSLGTTSTSTKAGIALSSTKLLIKS